MSEHRISFSIILVPGQEPVHRAACMNPRTANTPASEWLSATGKTQADALKELLRLIDEL